jgi:hypothetical protein
MRGSQASLQSVVKEANQAAIWAGENAGNFTEFLTGAAESALHPPCLRKKIRNRST